MTALHIVSIFLLQWVHVAPNLMQLLCRWRSSLKILWMVCFSMPVTQAVSIPFCTTLGLQLSSLQYVHIHSCSFDWQRPLWVSKVPFWGDHFIFLARFFPLSKCLSYDSMFLCVPFIFLHFSVRFPPFFFYIFFVC